ncbi:probable cytochrome P450 4s3 [Chrysoperla carnea]|uniref:probable cytochrome P450 4s3 n=1 Tax=Chrysoperla carnea TaxID=189513 RepID=UPI001D06F1C6|nr:probable cytochrome P450 4s3 [Chrysoperla carnea]
MIEIIIGAIVAIVVALYVYFELPLKRIKRLTSAIPGPKGLPIVGILFDVRKEKAGTFGFLWNNTQKYGPIFKIPSVGRLAINMTNPEDIEVLLKNNEILDKPYSTTKFFKPWLGNGLVFSAGPYWKQQRKLITPTFHFNILEKFFEVFNEQGDILIKLLKEKADGKTNIDIFPYMQSFALDVICETAMGTKIHAQTSARSAYVLAVQDMERIIVERFISVIQQIDFLFPFTENGQTQRKALQILKESTDKLIRKRRDDLIKESENKSDENQDDSFGTKKRLAFLDLMLQARNMDGTPLTNEQISDEVSTFTFAGHDTTSTQLAFLFYLLSKNPHIQEEIYKEQCDILMGEKRDPTFQEVQEMHYLERTIKEAQRLLPSVPLFSRQVTKDLQLKTNNYLAPEGSILTVFTFGLHRNPNIYPDPEKFDPDRFLPENLRERNPYSFVPFSAGPRNCIGQKFAMLEMKTSSSKILRNFKILPAFEADGTPYEPDLRAYIVLTAVNGVQVRLVSRT